MWFKYTFYNAKIKEKIIFLDKIYCLVFQKLLKDVELVEGLIKDISQSKLLIIVIILLLK